MNRLPFFLALAAALAWSGDWSAPVEVRHEDNLCVSYQARIDGSLLVLRATLGTGWHTFAMDNQRRAEEKLAGKPAISMDRNTEVTLISGLELAGPWRQSPPKDFSRPQLRWFSWGFDRQAVFAARIRNAAGGPGAIRVRGQACTETVCKNIDVTVRVPASKGGTSTLDWDELEPVREKN